MIIKNSGIISQNKRIAFGVSHRMADAVEAAIKAGYPIHSAYSDKLLTRKGVSREHAQPKSKKGSNQDHNLIPVTTPENQARKNIDGRDFAPENPQLQRTLSRCLYEVGRLKTKNFDGMKWAQEAAPHLGQVYGTVLNFDPGKLEPVIDLTEQTSRTYINPDSIQRVKKSYFPRNPASITEDSSINFFGKNLPAKTLAVTILDHENQLPHSLRSRINIVAGSGVDCINQNNVSKWIKGLAENIETPLSQNDSTQNIGEFLEQYAVISPQDLKTVGNRDTFIDRIRQKSDEEKVQIVRNIYSALNQKFRQKALIESIVDMEQ